MHSHLAFIVIGSQKIAASIKRPRYIIPHEKRALPQHRDLQFPTLEAVSAIHSINQSYGCFVALLEIGFLSEPRRAGKMCVS